MSTYSAEISASIIHPVINYNINFSKYNILVGSSYIDKRIRPSKKRFNIQNTVEN